MSDPFASHGVALASPVQNAASIVPSDGADLPSATRAINVATAGVVRVTLVGMGEGASVDLTVAAGFPFGARVKRVWATGTTATGIVGLW